MGLGLVNLSVLALHKRMPALRRPFKVPLYPWIPILGAISCWIFVPALELRSLLLGGGLTVVGAGIYLLRPTNRADLALHGRPRVPTPGLGQSEKEAANARTHY